MTRTTRLDLLLCALYTVLSVAGLVTLKIAFARYAAARPTVGATWGQLAQFGAGAALYAASFGLWLLILSRCELSTAYPVSIGLTLCLSTVAAFAILDEPLGVAKMVGIGLVLAGIVMIFRGPS